MNQSKANYPAALDLVFAEDFINATQVGVNGGEWGVLGGTISNGADFRGTSGYLVYPEVNVFTRDTLTIYFEFTPDYAADDGGLHYIYYGDGDNYLLKWSTSDLWFKVGGTFVSIALGVYQSYWNVNEKNKIAVVYTPGNNRVYLNGHHIITNGGTSPSDVINLSIGHAACRAKYENFLVSSRAYSLAELDDLYAGTTFDYMNQALLVAPMQDRYGVGPFYTTDSSKYSNLITLGDGPTPATRPTLVQRGQGKNFYRFDTSDWMITPVIPAANFTTSDSFTIAMMVAPRSSGGYLFSRFSFSSDGYALLGVGNKINLYYGNNNTATSNAIFPITGPPYLLTVVYDAGMASFYKDTIFDKSVSGLFINSSNNPILINARYNGVGGSANSSGDYHFSALFPRSLTQTQINDLAFRLQSPLEGVL